MQRKLVLKLLAIGLLSFLLLIPLAMIESQIAQRSYRQDDVTRNIAESAAGEQTLIGPVLLVNYRERIQRRVPEKNKDGEILRERLVDEVVERTQVFPAQRTDLDGTLAVDTLKRGLYRVRLYHLDAALAGSATVPPRLGRSADAELIDAQATLVLGVADPRGIKDDPEVKVNGVVHRLATGTAGAINGAGVHVPLGAVDLATGASYDFSLPLKLTGLARLSIAPTANATRVAITSAWQHPSFQGRFLPLQRRVDESGFAATGQVSHLARDFDRALLANTNEGRSEVLGISLIDPVNVYLTAERAVKYGSLFVVLTFAGLFLMEIVRRLPVHPMQYLLVGLALAIFFLLLIALSEHVEFLIAYGVSAIACIALLGVYLAGVLGSWARGIGVSSGIAALYGVLYGVLVSEDNALLMGTLLLFAALGTIMLATRRLDWYGVAPSLPATEGVR